MTTLGRRMNRRQDRCNLLGLCLTLGSRNGHHNQNRSKLLGLLLAGFSPRPSNLGCSLGTGSKQDRHTLLSPLMSRNSLCKRIAGAETECPSLLDLHPDAKQDRQLATKKAECQSLLDLHQDVKQDGRLLGHQEGRVPEPAGPPPAKQPGKREPQALPLQPPAKKTASASAPAAGIPPDTSGVRQEECGGAQSHSKDPARPSRCAELGRKGRERQASGISGPQRKGQGHGPKGSGPRPTPRRKGPSR